MELSAVNVMKVLLATFLAIIGIIALIRAPAGRDTQGHSSPIPTALDFREAPPAVTQLDDTETGAGVCVYNNAWFVMRYQMKNLRTGEKSDWSSNYGALVNKCMVADEQFSDIQEGDQIQVTSDVELGLTKHSEATLVYEQNSVSMVNFKCTGTTLYYACNLGEGTTVENVTAAVEQFALGFAAGLAEELGFDDCINSTKDVYDDLEGISDDLAKGITSLSSDSILTAFQVIGKVLLDFGDAIYQCVKASSDLVDKIKDIANILALNVASLIKTVVTDVIQIIADSTDITALSKSVTADWNNGDYQGSGTATGQIVGILVEDLGRRRSLLLPQV